MTIYFPSITPMQMGKIPLYIERTHEQWSSIQLLFVVPVKINMK